MTNNRFPHRMRLLPFFLLCFNALWAQYDPIVVDNEHGCTVNKTYNYTGDVAGRPAYLSETGNVSIIWDAGPSKWLIYRNSTIYYESSLDTSLPPCDGWDKVNDCGDITVTGGCSAGCVDLVSLNYSETPGIRTASDGAAQDKLGCGLGLDGGVAIAGAPDDKIGSQNKQGSAYMFLQNQGGTGNWGQLKQIKASDGAAVDYFGNSVSIDGATALVGAHGDNVGALTDPGSVYIFEQGLGGPDNWGERKRVSAADAQAYAYFGNAVSLKNGRAVIGASKHKEGMVNARGAAYIFEKDAGGTDNWGQVQKLVASDGIANNFFGQSVAQSGDLVLVGANGNLNNRGAAYLFDGSSGWVQTQKFVASDAAVGDGFGTSLSLSSDYAIIGTPNKTTYTGAAYVFKNNAGTWSELKKLTASDGAVNDRFGATVVLRDDHAYVSAIRANGNAGAVYVFRKDAGGPDNWGQVGKYSSGTGAPGDQFGFTLAASGDMLAIGANMDDVGAKADQGSVSFFFGETCSDATRPAGGAVSAAFEHPNIALPAVQCSPNPFRDELTIDVVPSGISNLASEIRVMDAVGRLMARVGLPAGTGRFTLKTNEFRAGMYFVQVASEEGVQVVPVVLVR